MPTNTLRYTRCAVMVHGKSELYLAKYICSNLRIPYKMVANNNGRSSIQINGIWNYLKKKPFINLKAFAEEYSIEYDKKQKKLLNFKLFMIMDTDDCDERTKEMYISGELFKGHPLEEYIVPIYNIGTLENVLYKAGLTPQRLSSSDKGEYYKKIFPINTQPMSYKTIDQVRAFAQSIKGIKETNLLEFVEYCIQQLPGETLWVERSEYDKK